MRSVILISLFSLLCAASSEQYKSIDNAQQLTQFTQSSPLNALLFVDKQQCTNEQDEKCRQQRDQIEQIADLCANDKIQFATSTNSQLAEKQFNIYGTLPKLCFFRDGLPIIYSGAISNLDQLQEWFSETRERLTRSLDDKSFEHDTQAASGSTTGDWFVLFKKSNDSLSLTSIWEATSFNFRNRAIFAYVDVDQSPLIQKRFHLFNLPSFILLKRGKMYRYESTSWKESAFVEFLERGYDKVKAEPVPPEASGFSLHFDSISKNFPMYLIVIPMICLVGVLLVLISGLTKKKKTTTSTERTAFQVKID